MENLNVRINVTVECFGISDVEAFENWIPLELTEMLALLLF